jgi:hypothetical protein
MPVDRDRGCCLRGAWINAGVNVDGAVGHEKEKGIHIDINGVDEEVIDNTAGCCDA